MDKEVAIIAYAQLPYEADNNMSREVMVLKATRAAIEAAGLKREDLDTVITANNDYNDGRTISNMRLVEPAGSWHKNESKVEMDGTFGVLYALTRILSGDHDIALVVGESQASVYGGILPGIMMLDPTFDRQRWLLNEVSAAALQASAYMAAAGVSAEQIAAVAAKNLDNAALNPFALRSLKGADAKKVLASRPLYSPITELMTAPRCDGACAVVMASAKAAAKVEKPVWIKGVGFSHDSYVTERSLDSMGSLKLAADACYRQAGIEDPASQIDLAEVHECFAHEELMAYEALGFCEPLQGGVFFDSGATRLDGKLPVNASGGALGANAEYATGLARIIEAAMQIRGDAGRHQVKGVKTAVAHGQTGICAQENIVYVLGGE
ncbi:MAG: thiolase family protein [Actinomycetota bacterium]|nr:thiolase family protein [Actinomycetota bacterium]MDD5665786.1 thiolase family protein [Actinomycetota bacterium]